MSRTRRSIRTKRSGKILVIVAMLLPSLLLVVALVVEGGLALAMHGELRTISDSCARVVALSIEDGANEVEAEAAVSSYISHQRHLPAAIQVEVHIPPTSGPYLGNGDFAEVLLTSPLPFTLGSIWSDEARTIQVRSVAGVEDVSLGARIVVLNEDDPPGLSISGAGKVRVSGGVIINSSGGGLSENGEKIDGIAGYAASVVAHSGLWADDVQVRGGVNDPTSFFPLTPAGRPPLRTQCKSVQDPFCDLPLPSATLGVDQSLRGSVSVSLGMAELGNGNAMEGQWAVLRPGVYESIEIRGGKVRFEPGVYVLRGGKVNSLSITGGEVDGSAGIMFYNTGHDFEVSTGWPDSEAGAISNPTGSKFGGILINASADLQPLSGSGPFSGILIYQRRDNPQSIEIQGQGAGAGTAGTMYAKNALLKISGSGVLNGQFVVGRLAKTGFGDLSIETSAPAPTTARKTFLVE